MNEKITRYSHYKLYNLISSIDLNQDLLYILISMLTENNFYWEKWGISCPEKGLDVDFFLQNCPKCIKTDKRKATQTLLTNKDGNFLCHLCGYHGNAQLKPEFYKEKFYSFPNSWWSEKPQFEKIDFYLKSINKNLSYQQILQNNPDYQIFLGKEYIKQKKIWEPSLLLPCKKNKNNRIDDFVILNFSKNCFTHERMVGVRNIPLGWDDIKGSEIIIVNNPIDKLVLDQINLKNVVCLPLGLDPRSPNQNSWRFLEYIEEDMLKIKKITFCFSNNEPDSVLEEELARRIGKKKCFKTRLSFYVNSPEKIISPTLALEIIGEQKLYEAISEAKPFPINGIYDLGDVEEQLDLLYEFGLNQGMNTGWPSINSFYTVKTGQWTLITGIPGHGKSTWLDALLVNLAQEYDIRFALFSPENQPIERHFASLMEKRARAPFGNNYANRMSSETKNELKPWIDDHFKIILPDDSQGNWTLDGILALAAITIYRYGIKGLVIDPWNEIDHARPPNVNETDHISSSLTKIRRFARLHDIHIWLVAHPTKLELKADGKYPVPTPYSVSGSAHWRNKSDNAIAVYRNVGDDDDDICDVHIQKIRFREIGTVGRASLRYDRRCGVYIDDIDQIARERALLKGLVVPSREIRVVSRENTENSIKNITDNIDLF